MIPDYVVSRQGLGLGGGQQRHRRMEGWRMDGGMIRPLGLTNADDKTLKEGGFITSASAVHDDNITTRGHHVSFNKTLGLGVKKGTKVDINAVKLPLEAVVTAGRVIPPVGGNDESERAGNRSGRIRVMRDGVSRGGVRTPADRWNV